MAESIAKTPNAATQQVTNLNALALKAAKVLQSIVLSIVYTPDQQPRELRISGLDNAGRLLGLLLNPEGHEREAGDPKPGDIESHLAHISSELEGAVDDMQAGITGVNDVGLFAMLEASTRRAFEMADRLLIAYMDKSLPNLRALTTHAGVLQRERPTLAVVKPHYNLEQCHSALEIVASHACTLNDLLMLAQRGSDPYDGAILVNAAQIISQHIGGLADEARDGGVLGNFERWHYGPNFADQGKGAAA